MRALTHTLRLHSVQSLLGCGPRSEWLRDVLTKLPSLQSLWVSQLPFFDHQSLSSLRSLGKAKSPKAGESGPTFALKLFVATQCPNATSSGLSEALLYLSNLVFLDLSQTTGARDASVLQKLKYMHNLQVLKLRRVNLRDEDVIILADSISIRVRSLDISGNVLTDASVETLLHLCFSVPVVENESEIDVRLQLPHRGLGNRPNGYDATVPSYLESLQDDTLDEHFLRHLAKPVVGRLPSEDLPHSGITHLYMSDNMLTFKGLSRLIKSGCAYVLDVGRIIMKTPVEDPPSFVKSSPLINSATAKEMLSLLKGLYNINLRCFRVNYAIVMAGVLKDQQEAFHLPSKSNINVPLHLNRPNSTNSAFEYEKTRDQIPIRSLKLPVNDNAVPNSNIFPEGRVQKLLDLRQHSKSCGLTPSMLPGLHKLTLTNIPIYDPTHRVIDALIRLIYDCALEEELSDLQLGHFGPLQLDEPDRYSSMRQDRASGKSFSLSKIVLEMESLGPGSYMTSSPVHRISSSSRIDRSRSSTEDVDSEALWVAQENDFTFFDDEKCGPSKHHTAMFLPLGTKPKSPLDASCPRDPPGTHPVTNGKLEVDVVRALMDFRRERRFAYVEAMKRGERHVDGHWTGDIMIVRSQRQHLQKTGEIDFYGNYSKQGIYR